MQTLKAKLGDACGDLVAFTVANSLKACFTQPIQQAKVLECATRDDHLTRKDSPVKAGARANIIAETKLARHFSNP
jgi:hypothetical protein